MSESGASGDIKESSVDDVNKIDIEPTDVNLGCVKNEPNEEDSQATRYRITLEYENIFGEPSHQLKIEEDYDNLIGFLDNDVIMENAMLKLEAIKEEDDGSFNNFHCRKCKGIYKGYCLICSTLLHILNNNLAFINSESQSNTIPTDILEIRGTSGENGVYLLRTLPINVIFGPFEGILGIESTVGYSWKVIDNKLMNIKFGNWMKNIASATSALLKNLDIFQIDGKLYFQTNREITEGEELLIYYDDVELQQLENSKEYLYTPQKQEKLPKIFACTMCCMGFGSNKCLMEHKRKCFWMEHSRSMNDFVLIECHYCKMWMEKWEHEEHHVVNCLEKHHRMWSEYSEAVDPNDANAEEMGDDCGTRTGKRRYRLEICSRPKDRKDVLQFDTKNYQWFSGANRETCVRECTLAEQSNKKQLHNEKSHLQKHLNKHRGIKSLKCDICMMNFFRRDSLKRHIRNKHTDDANGKDYKCSNCSYATNSKSHFQQHLNTHRGMKPLKCDICKLKFSVKRCLKLHIRNKHTDDANGKDYKCSNCSYATNSNSHFQRHLNTHRDIKPLKCDVCMMKFSRKDSLMKHISNKHTDDGGMKDYKCFDCSYATNDKGHFQRHLNRHTGIKPFQCYICMMKFSRKDNLKTHIRKKHTDDANGNDYKCSECSFTTNYKYSLQVHLKTHKGIKPFTCAICMVEFTQKSDLKRHIKIKHAVDGSAKDYQCSECSFTTKYKYSLPAHLKTHKGIKAFQCDICMVKFTRKSHLTSHIKIKHAADGSAKDYQCSECSFTTNYKSSLQAHLKTHKGIKAFTCEICMMEFARKHHLAKHIKNRHAAAGCAKDYQCSECSFTTNYKYSLQVHLKTHRGIKAFTCEICMMKFTQKSDLTRHIKNKHAAEGSAKDYQCLECSYETNFKSYLKRHLNKHRGIKPFKCDICMMEFARKDYLAKHIKNKHTGDENVKD